MATSPRWASASRCTAARGVPHPRHHHRRCVEEAERMMLLAGCARRGASPPPAPRSRPAPSCWRGRRGGGAASRAKVAQTLMEVASGVATRARHILCAAREGAARHRGGLHAQAPAGRQGRDAEGDHGRGLRAAPARPFGQRAGLRPASRLPRPQAAASLGGALRAAQPERKIAVEAETVDEAVRFAGAGAMRCSSTSCRRSRWRTWCTPWRRAAQAADRRHGRGDEGNAAAYARAGAELLVTSAPYAAPPPDVAVAMAAGGS